MTPTRTLYWDDCYDAEEEFLEREFCFECQGTGRIPAPDYYACEGFEEFACPDCEAGSNSGEVFESEVPTIIARR